MPSRAAVFHAVFPSAAPASTPTPQSTPRIGAGSFHAAPSFAADTVAPDASTAGADDVAAATIRRERAWHAATTFLSLPHAPVTAAVAAQSDAAIRMRWVKACGEEAASAIRYLVARESVGWRMRKETAGDSLVEWYAQEVGRHFVAVQLPVVRQVCDWHGDVVRMG